MSDIGQQMREAHAILSGVHPPGSARRIIEEVAAETSVPVAMILGRCRDSVVVDARFMAIRRVAEETGWSLPRIGAVFKRHHTTILNALRRMGVEYRSLEQGGVEQ